MKLSPLFLAGAASLALAQAAVAEDASSLSAGRRVAAAQCGGCHAIDREGESPNPRAPKFRDMAAKFQLDDLREALVMGMIVGHPALMPKPNLRPTQIDDLIAYMKSLKQRSAENRPKPRLRPAAS